MNYGKHLIFMIIMSAATASCGVQLSPQEQQIIQQGSYPGAWDQEPFSRLINRLNNRTDRTFFIQWCNAIMDGIKNNFYGEGNNPKLFINIVKNLQNTISNNEDLKNVFTHYNDMRGFSQTIISAIQNNFHIFNKLNLMDILDNLGKLPIDLPAPFLDAWQQQFAALLEKADVKEEKLPVTLSRSLKILTALKIDPERVFLNAWFEKSQKTMNQFTPQELSNSIYSFANLNRQPSKAWLDAWYEKSLRKMDQFNSQALSNSIYALANLNVLPEKTWLNTWYEKSLGKMDQFNSQALSNSIYALANLNVLPEKTWLNTWYEKSQGKMGQFSPQALSNSIYALANLNVLPEETWLNTWYEKSQGKMGQFYTQALSNSIYALAKLHADDKLLQQPSKAWLDTWYEKSQRTMDQFKPQELSNSIYALANLNVLPEETWLNTWDEKSLGKMDQFSPQNLCNSIYALANLNVLPEERWLNTWDKNSRKSIDQFNSQDLSNSIYALTLLSMLHNNKKAAYIAEYIFSKLNQNLEEYAYEERQQLLWSSLHFDKTELHKQIRTAMKSPQEKPQPSSLQEEITPSLKQIARANQLTLEKEKYIPELATFVDFTMTDSQRQIAIEIDGPDHFFYDTKTYLPKSRLKTKLLEKLGWKVVRIPYYEWNDVKNNSDQSLKYLKNKIDLDIAEPSRKAQKT